jgi:hypothetical protein
MTDDLSHRLSSIADEMERAARGKSAEDLHELFAEACELLRVASDALAMHERRSITIKLPEEHINDLRSALRSVGCDLEIAGG